MIIKQVMTLKTKKNKKPLNISHETTKVETKFPNQESEKFQNKIPETRSSSPSTPLSHNYRLALEGGERTRGYTTTTTSSSTTTRGGGQAWREAARSASASSPVGSVRPRGRVVVASQLILPLSLSFSSASLVLDGDSPRFRPIAAAVPPDERALPRGRKREENRASAVQREISKKFRKR